MNNMIMESISMKSFFKSLTLLAMSAITVVSCQKEQEGSVQKKETVKLTIRAIAENLSGDTKTYISDKSILWGTGEFMTAALVSGDDFATYNSNSESADEFEGESQAMFEFDVKLSASPIKYGGIYPTSTVVTSNNTDPVAFKVQLPNTQNATTDSYDPAAYIMIAKPEELEQASTEWVTTFRRATALNKITLKNLAADIVAVSITVPDETYLAGGRKMDLTTGSSGDIYSDGGRTNTITVNYATALASSALAKDVWFTSWEASVPEGAKMTIVAYSDQYSYTKEITAKSGGINFKEGFLNTLSINMQGITPQIIPGDQYVKVTKAKDDWSGNYLFVYSEESTNYAFDSSLETLDVTKNFQNVTISDGKIAFDEKTAAVNVTIAKILDSDYYSIRAANGQYIGYTSESGNKLDISDKEIINSISFDNDKNTIIIKNPNKNNKLQFNSTSDNLRFRYYNSDQKAIDLYKLNGGYSPTFPVLNVSNASFASNEINVTIPVMSNRNWTASITEGADNVENGILTTASGSGNGNITFRFNGTNPSAITDRTVKIKTVAGENEKEVNITVTQKALIASLTLNAPSAEVEAATTEYTFNVTANFSEWSVLSYKIGTETQDITSDNCIIAKTGNNGTVTVKFPSNASQSGSGTSARTISIEVGYIDVITKSASFTQKGDSQEATSGWILKELDNISSTDKVVIVSSDCALSNGNGTTSSPNAVSVTIVGNQITSDVSDEIKWTIIGNSTDGYSLCANGDITKKLFVNTTATSGSNTNLRVGTGDRSLFTFENNTFKTKDDYTARHVNLYDKKDWRGYTSNSTSTDIKFYKFVDGRTPQTGFGYNVSAATYDLKDNTWSTLTAPALSGALATVSYSSSNTNVATISTSGTVTIMDVGETIITASTPEDDPIYQPASSSYTLTVINTTPVLTLNKTNVAISAASATNATITEAYSLTYAGDKDVTVGKDGHITAASINSGTVTYTISANETSSTYDSHINLTLSGVVKIITITQAAAGKTPMVVPSKPSVTAYTTAGVTASWTAPTTGPTVSSYDWLISTSDNINEALENIKYSGNVTTTTFTKANTFEADTYYVYVRSKGDDLTTEPSEYVRSDSFTIKTSQTYSCSFNSKSWGVASGGTISWTSDKDAYQYSTPNVQVTSACSGAGATTISSYTNITKIRIKASTTAKGVGNITIKVGTGSAQKICSLSKNTTATFYDLEFSTPVSGKVTFVVNCSTNSMYVQEAQIIADAN